MCTLDDFARDIDEVLQYLRIAERGSLAFHHRAQARSQSRHRRKWPMRPRVFIPKRLSCRIQQPPRGVREAERVLMIDGCFLRCHQRVLKVLIPAERVFLIDAHRIRGSFADAFSRGEVSEVERKDAAARAAKAAREFVGQQPCHDEPR